MVASHAVTGARGRHDHAADVSRACLHSPCDARAYTKLCDEGIEWKVFRYEFVKQFPWVSNLAQEAGNAGQQIARCESRISLMFKIASIANRHHTDGSIAWDKVIQEATRAGFLFPGEIGGVSKIR